MVKYGLKVSREKVAGLSLPFPIEFNSKKIPGMKTGDAESNQIYFKQSNYELLELNLNLFTQSNSSFSLVELFFRASVFVRFSLGV
jgi:hypothetical protein